MCSVFLWRGPAYFGGNGKGQDYSRRITCDYACVREFNDRTCFVCEEGHISSDVCMRVCSLVCMYVCVCVVLCVCMSLCVVCVYLCMSAHDCVCVDVNVLARALCHTYK